MTKMKPWSIMMLIVIVLSMMASCKNDEAEYGNETCIKNKTSYDWHDAGVQFMDNNDKNVKYVNIGAVEKNGYRYVPIAADYFVVDFIDNNGKKHQSEKYYSNPYVDVSFLVK